MALEGPDKEQESAMIPGRRIHVATSSMRVGPHQSTCREPVMELVREGAVIRSIRVTCGCGETLVLDCEYGADQA